MRRSHSQAGSAAQAMLEDCSLSDRASGRSGPMYALSVTPLSSVGVFHSLSLQRLQLLSIGGHVRRTSCTY